MKPLSRSPVCSRPGVDSPLVDDLHAMIKQARQLGIEPVQPVYLNRNEN